MNKLIVGLDVGGTKTDLAAETLDGRLVFETTFPSKGWDAEPLDAGAAWISNALATHLIPDSEVLSLGVGAQGLDTAAVAHGFERALGAVGLPARAINDAGLLVPAAGFDAGIGVISGTGAIAVASDAAGELLVTGGWGWVIGDEAGAAGIVRVATQRALLAHDDGAVDDGLLGALLADFGVDDAERLARAVNDEPTMDNWGPHASAVFDAADAGSALADSVIRDAAGHLARLVAQLRRRGAVGTDIVASGGVISHQPRLFDAFAAAVDPALRVHLLGVKPVRGAVALARLALLPQ